MIARWIIASGTIFSVCLVLEFDSGNKEQNETDFSLDLQIRTQWASMGICAQVCPEDEDCRLKTTIGVKEQNRIYAIFKSYEGEPGSRLTVLK